MSLERAHDQWKVEKSHGDTRVRAFTWNSREDTSFVSVSGMSSKVGNDKKRVRDGSITLDDYDAQ